MNVIGFSIDNQGESQLCLQEVDDEYCQKLKTGIMLGADAAASDADKADVYLEMKKMKDDAKKWYAVKLKILKRACQNTLYFQKI